MATITNLEQMIKRRRESDRGDWPENLLLLQCYVHRLRDAFVRMDKLITIACSLPVSTASSKRSFSTSQIVKSYTWEPVWETTDLRQHRTFTHHWKLDSHVFVNHLAVLTHRSFTVVIGASVDVVSVALWTCSSSMSGSSRRTIRTSSMQTFTLYLTALRARLRNSTILNLYNFTA